MGFSEKQYAVIGLGRFGLSLCQELQKYDVQVLAIDLDEERVKYAAGLGIQAVVADCADEQTVSELGLADYDMIMNAIGADMNSNILTTLVIKELGAKKVWVKANDRFHAKILRRIGADNIIFPDWDMGIRVARNMLEINLVDFHSIGSGIAILEITVDEKDQTKKIRELDYFTDESVKMIALKRQEEVIAAPDEEFEIMSGDLLIMTGSHSFLSKKIKQL